MGEGRGGKGSHFPLVVVFSAVVISVEQGAGALTMSAETPVRQTGQQVAP